MEKNLRKLYMGKPIAVRMEREAKEGGRLAV
jgi:hypothetical protein